MRSWPVVSKAPKDEVCHAAQASHWVKVVLCNKKGNHSLNKLFQRHVESMLNDKSKVDPKLTRLQQKRFGIMQHSCSGFPYSLLFCLP